MNNREQIEKILRTEFARKGGKSRWAKVNIKERSKILSWVSRQRKNIKKK